MRLSLCSEIHKIKTIGGNCEYINMADDTVVVLKESDVIYAENFDRKTLLVTRKGELVITTPFSKIKRLLEANGAFGCSHCSYTVNCKYIKDCKESYVKLSCGKEVYTAPVSRRKRKDFFEVVNQYKRRR